MKLTSQSFPHGGVIPERCAFARIDPTSHATLAENRSPELGFVDVPAAAKSLVLICHDLDAPTRPDHVNKEGVTVPASLPRADFAHWVLIDLPPTVRGFAEGEWSNAVTARGKAGPAGPGGTRQGLNNYTEWFAGDADMEGKYFGYDGPCPPWNDEIPHRYEFTLYALDAPRCAIDDGAASFGRAEVLAAIRGHVLAAATYAGTYTLNPALR